MKFFVHVFVCLVFLAIPLCVHADDSKGRISVIKRMNTANAYTPKALGLFIGIETFNDPTWHQLKYPKKDVSDISGFFSNNKALSLDYQMTLTDVENTTRDYILNHALDQFGMKNSSEEDVVFVYFSGHGTLVKEQMTVFEDGIQKDIPLKRPYIVTSDTRADKVADSALALNKVIDWFDRLASKRKVLILDMCHSGIGKSQLSPEQLKQINSAKGIHFVPMEDSWASIILSACPMGGTSYEDENLSNSVYTHFLLEGMNQGDLNGDGAITISEAHNYAIDKTRAYTFEHKGYKQVPTAYSKILGRDPIVVNGTPGKTAQPVLFSYASANQGVEVFVDKAYKGMLPKGMKIDPGNHVIECKIDGQIVFRGTIEFSPGFEYMLPHFVSAKREKKTFIALESGYRSYYNRNNVSEDLVPDGMVTGLSVYHRGIVKPWIALSGGFDFSRNSDLEQYAIRTGIKFLLSEGNWNVYAGPDVMYLDFRYSSDSLGTRNVDQHMSFFCPGAEALISWDVYKDFVLSAGVRSYYMPYEMNSTSEKLISGQVFFNAGYSF